MRREIVVVIFSLIVSLLSLIVRNPTFFLIELIYFGLLLNIGLFKSLEGIEVLLLSPGTGMVALIILALSLGRLGVPLKLVWPTVSFLIVLLGYKNRNFELNLNPKRDFKILTFLGFSVLLAFVVRKFYFLLPDYRAADTWFHGSKVKMMITSDSPYFSTVPPYFSKGIITYPPGYHVIAAYLSGGISWNIIFSMNTLRLFEIAYLPIAVYLVGRTVKEEVGVVSAFITPLVAINYYFEQYWLLPAVFNYIMFLFAVFLLYKTGERKTSPIISGLFGGVLAMVHPYQFIAYEILLLIFLLALKRSVKSFIIVALISIALPIIFVPSSLNYATSGAKLNSHFENKDNLEFVSYIFSYTFLENGQILLGLAFLFGIILTFIKKHEKIVPLTLTFAVIIGIIADKIFFRIPIPYLSAIWNSERAFLLTTPIIPILEGYGMWETVGRHRKILLSLILASLLLTYPNISREHIANENSYLLDGNVIEFIKEVNEVAKNKTVATACIFDSGRWIPILTNTPIVCISDSEGRVDNSILENAEFLYIDSRGAGELISYPLDVSKYYWKYRIVLFRRGLWLFSLRANSTNQKAKEEAIKYYTASGVMTWLDSPKYFVHGFIIKNYATQKLLLEKYPYAISVAKNSTIAFSTKNAISSIKISVATGEDNQTISVYVDGKKVWNGKVGSTPETIEIKTNTSPGLHFLTIECKRCSYKNPLGIKFVELHGGANHED
ncbi:hypothetical protein Py04_0691 [Pyrococcus sp. ST04]|nr:hypothetical protein Py04_0691 [Pyrococcus sp. ST04]